MGRIAWVLFGCLAFLSSARAASFDCKKAATPTEKLICSNSRLDELDTKLDHIYRFILDHSSPNSHPAVVAAQRSWLSRTRNKCGDENCLIDAYISRIDDLNDSFNLLPDAKIVSGVFPPSKPIPVPSEVEKFVTSGTMPIDLERGDVNGDGKQDYLLVLDHLDSDGQPQSGDARELLVLVRRSDDSLELASSNTSILGCAAMVGAGGGILVQPTGKGFAVEYIVGAGEVNDSKLFRFEYFQQRKAWLLIQLADQDDDVQWPSGATSPVQDVSRNVDRPYDEGKIVRFDDIKGADYGTDCSP